MLIFNILFYLQNAYAVFIIHRICSRPSLVNTPLQVTTCHICIHIYNTWFVCLRCFVTLAAVQGIPYADAMNKTLVFAIFDFDRFSKHDQIGEVKVPLCQIDLAQTIEEWRELQSVEGEGGQVSSRKRSQRDILYFNLIIYVWPS